MACCFLIAMWVRDELSWERFHPQADRIYRVVEEVSQPDGIEFRTRTPLVLGAALKSEIPEITHATRSVLLSLMVEYGDKKFSDDALDFADPDFFEIFSFTLLRGDPSSALSNPHSIIVTESMCRKYFGDEDPMGKIMHVGGEYDVTVTGVMADMPDNTFWRFDFLMPTTFWGVLGRDINSWADFYMFTFILLDETANPSEVNAKIGDMIQKHRPESRIQLFLQPLTQIHLHALGGGGGIRYVMIFSIAAAVVLVLACINFISLTTARASHRAKEVGMRKVSGARRRDLVRQFLGESILMALVAFFISLFLVSLVLPSFNGFTNKSLVLFSGREWPLLFGFLSMTLVIGLASGLYPAFLLSSFKPVNVFKGKGQSRMRGTSFRRVLVVFQFSLTMILLAGTMVIRGQIRYMQSTDLGFDYQNLIWFSLDEAHQAHYGQLRETLLQHPQILAAGRTSSLPGFINQGTTAVHWDGKLADHEVVMHDFPVGYDFIETWKMEMAEGRSFSRQVSTDTAGYILNETAVRAMHLDGASPMGKRFSLNGREGIVIGVVRDFHHHDLHGPIEPLVLSYTDGFILCLRTRPEHLYETVAFLEATYESYDYIYPFEVTFVRDRFEQEYYISEKRLATLITVVTFLASLISCMGLFGLASYTTSQRVKEIGVRKVLGASVSDIVRLLSWEFTKWVVLGNVTAWPIAYLVMSRWLQNFTFRIALGWHFFAISMMVSLSVALGTIIHHAVKAACTDPARTLRYE